MMAMTSETTRRSSDRIAVSIPGRFTTTSDDRSGRICRVDGGGASLDGRVRGDGGGDDGQVETVRVVRLVGLAPGAVGVVMAPAGSMSRPRREPRR